MAEIVSKVTNPKQDNAIYQINPGDNPSVCLVPKVFTNDNYECWNKGMIMALSVKTKVPFVDGSFRTSDKINDPDNYTAWFRANNIVKS
jgi:hypothetical protein